MQNILIVEDDIALDNGIAISLKQEDFILFQAFTVKEARGCIKKHLFL